MARRGPVRIESGMTVLDIVSRHRATEAVFKRWDRQAGACICCQALFDTLGELAGRYDLDLERLLDELNAAADHPHALPSGR